MGLLDFALLRRVAISGLAIRSVLSGLVQKALPLHSASPK